jgi:hypothetical protein
MAVAFGAIVIAARVEYRRSLIRVRSEIQVLPGPLPATTSENAGPR